MRPTIDIKIFITALFLAATAYAEPTAQTASPPTVHLVWMGGNDCPPCRAWRQFELPKLEKTAEFQAIKFSYVVKVIRSPVPPAFFLPDDVKPYKDKLDFASGGLSGSPQVAILVNGEIFDYFQGTRSAEEIEQMLRAIRTVSDYPHKPCKKLTARRSCASDTL